MTINGKPIGALIGLAIMAAGALLGAGNPAVTALALVVGGGITLISMPNVVRILGFVLGAIAVLAVIIAAAGAF